MTPRKVSSGDRFGVTLLFSVIAHGVLALGLTFEYEKSKPSLPSLDVILVQSASGEKPTKADFLAQANNSGGGESEKAVRPSELVSSPISKNESGVAPRPMQASAPKPQPPTQRELLTQQKSKFSLQTEHEVPEQPPLPQPTVRDVLEKKLEMAKLAAEIQQEVYDQVIYIPLGQYRVVNAWRKSLSGVLDGPATPIFWNIDKSE